MAFIPWLGTVLKLLLMKTLALLIFPAESMVENRPFSIRLPTSFLAILKLRESTAYEALQWLNSQGLEESKG